MSRSKSNALYAALAVIAALLVLGGLALFYVAWRGVQMLKSEAAHVATVMTGDAAALAGKSDYVGSWSGGGITLDVEPSGHVDYERKEAHQSEDLHGSLSFDGPDMVIDVLVTKKKLHVDKPPHKTSTGWSMTLDGVELSRP
ncbi:MAG TPA: hypothetical protein VLM85_11790 [Polyangiaceae bacterium]|nr:hypothetical protein [Polyangiaceae bacterium]